MPKTVNKKRDQYITALNYTWLNPLYDNLTRWTMREYTFKRRLVEQAHIRKDHRILDLGCGTATLTILIKGAHPEADVVGLDGDPRILKVARAKVASAGLNITLDYGMAYELPYPDNSFDRVFSSLLFHHLTQENKNRTAKETFRVLRHGGELHVADFGKPDNALMRFISLYMRRLEKTADNVKGLLPDMFQNAGFDQIEESARYMTVFGSLSLYKARKPGS